jgi:flagellar hook-associated protein 2
MASNALLTVDGIPVGRPDNQVDDLVPGLSLGLTAVTTGPATIRTEPDTATALSVMESVVEDLNALKSLLRQVTARGAGGATAGDLAGDPAVQSLARELDGMLSAGLTGHGPRPVFLAEMGLKTERDGRITLDRAAFETAFETDPAKFRSVLQDTLASTGPGVAVQGMPALAAASGRHEFRRDPDSGAAWLGDIALTPTALDDGRSAYRVDAGPLPGVTLTVDPGITTTAIDFGQSLATILTDWIDRTGASGGAIARRQDQIADRIGLDSDAFEALTQSADAYETRMRARFAEMEQVITRLNSTGDYIQNLIDSFNAQT